MFLTGALVTALCVPAHGAHGAPAAAASTPGAIVERFTGGSVLAEQQGSPHFGVYMQGTYASSGQLGRGSFSIDATAVPLPPLSPIMFRRSDGMTLRGGWRASKPPNCGPFVTECMHATLHGTADVASADVYIAGSCAYPSFCFLMSGTLTLRSRHGYAVVDSNGRTSSFGGIEHLGDAATGGVVDLQRTPSGAGYWVVNAAGQVHAFGDARYFGGADYARYLSGQRFVSMSPTP